MKITITIENTRPWYWPYGSPEAWLKHEKQRMEYEHRHLKDEYERDWKKHFTKPHPPCEI